MYCKVHNSKTEYRKLGTLLAIYQKEILSFLAGTAADSIASDFYDYLKESLGVAHLVPLVKKDELEEISKCWKTQRDFASFGNLLSLAQIGTPLRELIKLFGEPEIYKYVFDWEEDKWEKIKGKIALTYKANWNNNLYFIIYIIAAHKIEFNTRKEFYEYTDSYTGEELFNVLLTDSYLVDCSVRLVTPEVERYYKDLFEDPFNQPAPSLPKSDFFDYLSNMILRKF
jgi:hypothetical protein